jgi:hypothetical protein
MEACVQIEEVPSQRTQTCAHKCTQCEYVSNRAFNLARHMVRSHTVSTDVNNQSSDVKNSSCSQTSDQDSNRTCSKCNKAFCRIDYRKKHELACKGVKTLVCACGKVFSSGSNLKRHGVTCAVTLNPPPKLITFHRSLMEFYTAHITENTFIEIAKTPSLKVAICDLVREVYREPVNRCIRKKSIQSNVCQVHIGNNKWELRNDADVIDSLVACLAESLCQYMNSKREKGRFKRRIGDFRHFELDRMLVFVSDNGTCNDDNPLRKEILSCYRYVRKSARMMCFTCPVSQ